MRICWQFGQLVRMKTSRNTNLKSTFSICRLIFSIRIGFAHTVSHIRTAVSQSNSAWQNITLIHMKPKQGSEKKKATCPLLVTSSHKSIIGTGCCINTPICQVAKCYHNFVVFYRRVLSNIDSVNPLSIQNRQQAIIFTFFLILLACSRHPWNDRAT